MNFGLREKHTEIDFGTEVRRNYGDWEVRYPERAV